MGNSFSNRVIYSQIGHWDYNSIGDTLFSVGDVLENQGVGRFVQKRIIFCCLEMMENVYHHSIQSHYNLEDPSLMSRFEIMKNESGFRICSGNVVAAGGVKKLRERLEKLKRIPVRDIRKYYVEQLKNGVFSEKGGAGLGIIEVVKISKNPIEYDLSRLDDEFSYLTLCIQIDEKTSSETTD